MTSGGCPIEDIATDISLNRQADDYIVAKHLQRISGDSTVYRMTIRKLGLLKSLETLIDLETIYAQWTAKQQHKQQR